jgi:hypothetical protein
MAGVFDCREDVDPGLDNAVRVEPELVDGMIVRLVLV